MTKNPLPKAAASPKSTTVKPKKPAPLKAERQLAQQIIAAALDTKAENVVMYDMAGLSPIADFVVVCSGRSQSHVRGVVDRVEALVKKELGQDPQVSEGYLEGSWVLLDYGDVILHVFHPETRAYYNLDELLDTFHHEAFASEDTPLAKPQPKKASKATAHAPAIA